MYSTLRLSLFLNTYNQKQNLKISVSIPANGRNISLLEQQMVNHQIKQLMNIYKQVLLQNTKVRDPLILIVNFSQFRKKKIKKKNVNCIKLYFRGIQKERFLSKDTPLLSRWNACQRIKLIIQNKIGILKDIKTSAAT